MPNFKNKLDELLADFVLAAGQSRSLILIQIRNYLNSHSDDQLRTEITQITSMQSLKALQAAGVEASLQDVFLRTLSRVGNLTGVL